MFSKLLFKLSKIASRKNLGKFINLSFENEIKKNPNQDLKILNIGSGGDIELLIKNKFNKVFSIDIDPKRKPDQIIDICDEKFINKIKFRPDIVCCFEVLEHTKEPRKAIDNIYQLLDQGGKVFLSVPFNFHIHDEPNDYYRFTYYGLKLIFNKFSYVTIKNRNGWLESIFVNLIRLEKENNIMSKFIGKLFIIIYFFFLPLILIIQKILTSKKLTTGYYLEAEK